MILYRNLMILKNK